MRAWLRLPSELSSTRGPVGTNGFSGGGPKPEGMSAATSVSSSTQK